MTSELDRLDERDREGALDVPSLTRLLQFLPELDRAAAYYRADRAPRPRAELLRRVYDAVGLNA